MRSLNGCCPTSRASWSRPATDGHHAPRTRQHRLQLTPAERYRVFLTRFPGLANRVKLRYVADFLGMSIYTLSRIRAGI